MKKITSIGEIQNEKTFVLCPCNNESVSPVVLHALHGHIIVALVCENCEREIPVLNGILQVSQSSETN